MHSVADLKKLQSTNSATFSKILIPLPTIFFFRYLRFCLIMHAVNALLVIYYKQ